MEIVKHLWSTNGGVSEGDTGCDKGALEAGEWTALLSFLLAHLHMISIE